MLGAALALPGLPQAMPWMVTGTSHQGPGNLVAEHVTNLSSQALETKLEQCKTDCFGQQSTNFVLF